MPFHGPAQTESVSPPRSAAFRRGNGAALEPLGHSLQGPSCVGGVGYGQTCCPHSSSTYPPTVSGGACVQCRWAGGDTASSASRTRRRSAQKVSFNSSYDGSRPRPRQGGRGELAGRRLFTWSSRLDQTVSCLRKSSLRASPCVAL